MSEPIEQSIGTIGNFYGGLVVKVEGGKRLQPWAIPVRCERPLHDCANSREVTRSQQNESAVSATLHASPHGINRASTLPLV